MRILHEDPDLIVVDKPPGLLTSVTPGTEADNLADRVRQMLRKKGVKPQRRVTGASPVPGIIHRLDREASGVLVFSVSSRGYAWLKEDFKHKRVHRLYAAVVHGEIGKVGDSGTVQSFLKEGRDGRIVSIAPDEYRGPVTGPSRAKYRGGMDEVAKLAVTHYRIVAVGNGLSLVQVRLASGRKHQIRVHLASKGHPIVGDQLYGRGRDAGSGTPPEPIKRLALHATDLGFTHPGTGQSIRVNSPAPASFYKVVGAEPPAPSQQAEQHRIPAASGGDGPRGQAAYSFDASSSAEEVAETSWNKVAAWYDQLIDEKKSDHYAGVIVPGVVRLVGPHQGMRVLDVACGQGVIARALAQVGASVTGVDAAPKLIEAANTRGGGTFLVGDAREVGAMELGEAFDAATCVMALSNIEPVEPVIAGVASKLKDGGAFVLVVSHPAFRAPGQTSWGWDQRDGRQFRRVDGYLSAGQHRIQMHPGDAPDVVTWTFHRPLQHYVRALAQAGLLVEGLEEWASRRVSEAGPRAEEENRARREIPLFIAIRAIKK